MTFHARDLNTFPFLWWRDTLAWENSQHFWTPPTASPRNDVWETSAEIPYWWRVTIQIWVVHLMGWRKFPSRRHARLRQLRPSHTKTGRKRRILWKKNLKNLEGSYIGKWFPIFTGHPMEHFEKKALKEQQSMNKSFWNHFRHFGRLLEKIYLFLISSKTDGRVPSQQGAPTTCNLTYLGVS